MNENNGYIFLCSDATEDDCLKKKLLGGTSSYFKHVKDLQIKDSLYLYNFNSKRLHGPFVATSTPHLHIVPDAWGGQYPVQVTYKYPKKFIPITRDHLTGIVKFNKSGFPSVKLTTDQVQTIQNLFESKQRYKYYGDNAALVTTDGHKVRSEGERKIDDWLFEHKIAHGYEYPIPNTKRCDFYVPSYDVYIEYWGRNDKAYLKNKEAKQKIYKKNNLNLLELVPQDLPKLNSILKEKFNLN